MAKRVRPRIRNARVVPWLTTWDSLGVDGPLSPGGGVAQYGTGTASSAFDDEYGTGDSESAFADDYGALGAADPVVE